jgi:hypothetical protein
MQALLYGDQGRKSLSLTEACDYAGLEYNIGQFVI